MSICLAMIVKDEEHILAQTLANLIQYIPISDYCISDTGSSDKTVEIIETFFAQHKIPGRVMHDTWVNFAHNRNLNLAHARQHSTSDYLFTFDADDAIIGSLPNLAGYMRANVSDIYTL
jgi:glycosyltransferase involved in cell wall biosynthesis